MKKLAFFLLSLVLVAFFAGCFIFDFLEDYYNRNRQFLSYSLGEYEIIVNDERTNGPHPYQTKRVWELQFTRQNGEEGQFRFVSCSFTNPRFYTQVVSSAIWMARDDIHRELANRYFAEEELTAAAGTHTRDLPVRVELGPEAPWFDRSIISSARVLNRQNGLRLYSVTPQELVFDWGVRFRIIVRVYIDEDYAEVFERLQAMTRTLSDYLGQDQIRIRLVQWNFTSGGNGTFHRTMFCMTYNRETGTFEENS